MVYLYLPPWLFPAVTVVVCCLAVWRGGAEERLAASGLLAGWAFTVLTYRSHVEHTQWGVLAVDAAVLALLVSIALRSERYWPIFAAGFHLLAVLTHLISIIDPRMTPWAYVTAEVIWGYLLAAAIAFGAWRHPIDARRAAGAAPPARR